MIKRLLMPTNFTVSSLNAVISYLSKGTDTKIELVLLHGHASSESMTEMLAFDKDDYLDECYSEDFLTACQIIKTRFEDQVEEIYSDIICSKNDRYIRNYLKGHKIAKVILPSEFEYAQLATNSFCTVALLRKNCQHLNIPIIELSATASSLQTTQQPDVIDNIFFRKDIKNATY